MIMKIEKYFVSEDTSIIDAMKVINQGQMSVAFVCDAEKRLIAAISDGDIRRHIICNGSLENPVKVIANYNPIFVSEKDNIDYSEYMRNHYITALPIVDEDMKIKDISFLERRPENNPTVDAPVVIMAGGKGSRLKPFTEILPKPLIPIGKKTITEHIIDRFMSFGCTHFDMIINYKKNFIKSYFTDCEHKFDIDFVEENEFLGTVGGLRLINGKYQNSFFLSNCDILIESDYKEIYDKHNNEKNMITLVCAKKKIIIPYGTVEVSDNNEVISLVEKPEYELITNTGLYVINPDFIKMIPEKKKIDMTDMITKCLDEGYRVGIYLVKESDWLDMGQLDEMERMKNRLGVV